MTHELASGDFIMLEICDKTNPCNNPVNKFRELCGPADSCIARALRPRSIRAEFGINKVQYINHFIFVRVQKVFCSGLYTIVNNYDNEINSKQCTAHG